MKCNLIHILDCNAFGYVFTTVSDFKSELKWKCKRNKPFFNRHINIILHKFTMPCDCSIQNIWARINYVNIFSSMTKRIAFFIHILILLNLKWEKITWSMPHVWGIILHARKYFLLNRNDPELLQGKQQFGRLLWSCNDSKISWYLMLVTNERWYSYCILLFS